MKKILCIMLLLAPTAYMMAQTSETVVTPNGKKVNFFPNLEPAWYLDGNTNGAIKSIGTKDDFSLPFITNNTEKMRLTNTGLLGINATNPSSAFYILNDNKADNYDDINVSTYSATASPAIFLLRARGVSGKPDPVAAGDPIGTLGFRGWDGTAYNAYSGMKGFSTGGSNSDLRFFTSNKEQLRVSDIGNVGIGRQDPSVKLDVYNPTAGAVKIVDGTQGVGKILTSDANGVATWKEPVTASTFIAPQGTRVDVPYDIWTYSKRSLTLSKGKWIITLTDRSLGWNVGATFADMIAGWSSSASSYIPSTLFANNGHSCVATQAVPSGNRYLNWNFTFVVNVTDPSSTIYLFFNASSDIKTTNVNKVQMYNGAGGVYSDAYGALIAQKVSE